jgi:hypothetical protein
MEQPNLLDIGLPELPELFPGSNSFPFQVPFTATEAQQVSFLRFWIIY